MSKAFNKLFKKKMSVSSAEKSSAPTPRSRAPPPNNLNPFSPSYVPPPPSHNLVDAPPPAYTASNPAPTINVNAPAHAPADHLYPGRPASINSVASSASRISDIVHNDNDKFAFLTEFDTIFLVDDSGSMAGSLWREASTVLSQITEVCTKRDKDGVDLYFLNHDSRKTSAGKASGGYFNLTSKGQVDRIFSEVSPRGGTFTGMRLNHILKPYLSKLQKAAQNDEDVKPINLIVITDGAPTDDPEDTIVHYAQEMDKLGSLRWQAGIQFFQVGNDPEATRALRELDDDLKKNHGCRDMVDMAKKERGSRGQPLTSDEILKVVLGAVQSKVDRKDIVGGKLV